MGLELSPGAQGWDYATRLNEARARVDIAEAQSGRAGSGCRVMVATKSFDADAVRAVCTAGALLVGENRAQELAAKGPALRETKARVHVIGPLQRNKAREAVAWADCVQTVDTIELAERLSRLCVEAERKLNVMIQVNVTGEPQKHGVAPDAARQLAAAVAALPALTVTGFMTVGLDSPDQAAVRAGYATLREIRDRNLILAERGENPELATAWELSMGMSRDLEWAVAEGATMVRIGTAIMGERLPRGH